MAEICQSAVVVHLYVYASRGKLLFMGDEFGQTNEWNYKSELDWYLLQYDPHKMLKDCVADLNKLLRGEPALYENQFNIYGFEWVDLNHRDQGVMVYRRKGKKPAEDVVIILNVTPVVHHDWKLQLSGKEQWKEIFNSDDKKYWGSGNVLNPDIQCEVIDKKGKVFGLNIHLPPLGAIVLK